MSDLQFHKQLIVDIFIAKIDRINHEDSGPIERLADYSIDCADILMDKMNEHFEESVEEVKVVPALDLSKIPENLYGQWLILERHNSKLLGSGHTIEDAISNADIDINAPGIVFARV